MLASAAPRPLLSRSLALLVTATTLLAIALGASASAAFADDIDAISGGPSNGTSEDSRTRFSYEVEPGQQVEDFYIVKNTGTTAQSLKLFATDAFNADDGAFALLDTADTPVDAGSWVLFEGNVRSLEIPLGPGESRIVSFTIDVPANAGPGDHPAGIVISSTSGSGEVLVDKRFATRLYVRVPGDLQPLMTITSISASYEPQLNPLNGSTIITATFKNSGNVALGAKAVIGVNTFFGIPLGSPQLQEVDELLPGSTRTISFTVDGIAQLGYLNAYVKAQPAVDQDAMRTDAIAQISRDTALIAVPWWLIILAVIAALVWLFLRIRRGRDERAAAAWIEYTEAEAQRKAIESAGTRASE